MLIRPGHKKLQYSGRIDFSRADAPVFVYPCTSVRIRFTGDLLNVLLRNRHQYWENYIGYIADGQQGKVLLEEEMSHVGNQEEGCLIYRIPLDPRKIYMTF